MQVEKSKQVEAKQNENYEDDVMKMSDISSTLNKDQSYFKIQYYVQQEQKQNLQKKGLTVEMQEKFNFDSYFSSDEILLTKYNAMYGSFLQFIDHRRKTIEGELNSIQFHKTGLTFFPTMRRILDSKWKEILISE